MISQIAAISILAVLVITNKDIPKSIVLQGTIRDFSCFHPDFESPADSQREQVGLLERNLSINANSKPIFIPFSKRTDKSLGIFLNPKSNLETWTKYAISNYGQFYHDEYYQNVPGVNIAIPISIELSLIDQDLGLYQYSSSNFFPINNFGYKRENINNILPQKAGNNNFWFTTEFIVPFYYKGGEQFEFSGDDDLWVFIDGMLTPCDLGGIHDQRNCTVALDSLSLEQYVLHEMTILHAERHYFKSDFMLTTSIVPANMPPVSIRTIVSVRENLEQKFQVQGFDPDRSGDLFVLITENPTNGTLSQPINVFLPFNEILEYQPNSGFFGEDTAKFILSDGIGNSTTSDLIFMVTLVHQPPVVSNESISISLGQNISLQLKASDPNIPSRNLTFNLISSSDLGYPYLSPMGIFVFQPIRPGKETLYFEVIDSADSYTNGQIEITVSGPPTSPPLLSPPQLAGIVVGSVAVVGVVAVTLIFLLYTYIVASKYEEIWEKEFYKTHTFENPLYKSQFTEGNNPLYQPKGETECLK